MNYIKQINAFYNKLEVVPLSGAAISLWHGLLHMNNKAAWAKEFTVPVSTLQMKTGLSDSAFKRSRRELEGKGYIQFRSRGGNQAAVYKITCLSATMDYSTDYREETVDDMDHSAEDKKDTVVQYDQKMNDNVNDKMTHKSTPLNKEKHKQKQNNKITTEAIAFYQENFSIINPYLTKEIQKWANDVGEELVVAAMKRALEQNKQHWNYVKGILQAWGRKGITTPSCEYVD